MRDLWGLAKSQNFLVGKTSIIKGPCEGLLLFSVCWGTLKAGIGEKMKLQNYFVSL